MPKKKPSPTSNIAGGEEQPGYGMATATAPGGPYSGTPTDRGTGVDYGTIPDPSKGGGVGSTSRIPTAKDIAEEKKRQEILIREHLAGPWTKESILGQYNGTVAGILGNQHPKAEQFARFGMENKMDQDTFSGWLRARPEYLQTENYRKAKGDYLSVLAEVFGYR